MRRSRRALGSAATVPAVPVLPGRARVERLANGLTVCLLENPQAPLVTSALWYRAGARDEPTERAGLAHFLEHMMFKGSARYGPGEIDRRTQVLGGVNNAFTSHDTTVYYFSFAADRWHEALAIEADRMAGLRLEPAQVASERQVILEEIAMYEDDPWDALEERVLAGLFGEHPYGRPVIGRRDTLLATTAEDLAGFHRDAYRPDRAVLVAAGDLGAGALDAVVERFGSLEPGAAPRPERPPPSWPARLERLERRQGEVARLYLALPAPPVGHPDHAPLRLLLAVLSGGRASRLHRALVDEGQLCLGVAADVQETEAAGALTLEAELLPRVAPAAVEAALRRELRQVAAAPPAAEELERARQIVLADFVFGHERVYQQALTAGFALALFDLEQPERELRQILATDAAALQGLAVRYLDPERGGVLGWSLPVAAA